MKALVLVQERNLESRNKLVPNRSIDFVRILDRINDTEKLEVVFIETLLQANVQFLANASVHTGFLLSDQVSQSDSLVYIFGLIKGNLSLLNSFPGLVDVIFKARLNFMPLVDVERKKCARHGLSLINLLGTCFDFTLLLRCLSIFDADSQVFFFCCG